MFELSESPLQKAILVQIYFPEKKGSFFSVNRFLEFKDLYTDLENRYLDLWINGKLYHARYLKNLPLLDEQKDLLTLYHIRKPDIEKMIESFPFIDFLKDKLDTPGMMPYKKE